ncbi:arsenate reductase/protein-tyrosine-phosphatase family protein [Streptomyces avermitilis]|uniref:arsenate reductase/protein-tyrosine-phosphatase family protein n=1 Tax=Streptomyces avermitilis TaxID=33903 RepID=UPI00368863A5
MTQVLFVCTGNVHRSVLAERLLAARLPPGSAVLPRSAGTQARPWSGMEASTRAVLEELGGDGSGFAARPLTAQLVREAALVLGLAHEHREAVVRLAPTALRRCFTLKEFVRLAVGGEPGGEGTVTTHGDVPDGQVPPVVDGFDVVVAAAAGRRGAAAPVPPAVDDISDPWGRPHSVLYGCAREIDGTVSTLARLLGGGASL